MLEGISNIQNSVDGAFLFITAISIIMLLGVTGVMVYFAVHYNRKRNPRADEIEGNMTLEITWTVLPTILVLVMFYVGYVGFAYMRTPPEKTMLVKVSSRMWSWLFEYENGRKEDTLVLPADQPIRLAITSEDVLHSLFIPAFRVKEDAVPGQETTMWFTAEKPGTYDIFCTEYCGVGHSSMLSTVKVLPKDEFDRWYEAKAARPAEKLHPGLVLLREKGCIGCHSTDGSRLVGPSFKDIIGREIVVVTGESERTIISDEEYIERSIAEPGADVVKGYPPVMPPIPLSEDEIELITDYLKVLSGKAAPDKVSGPDGAQILKERGCLGCHSTDGSRLVGPSFKGIVGRQTVVVTDGKERSITSDAEYIRRSILDPAADVVKGFPPAMPPMPLPDEEVNAVIKHLETLK